MFKKIILLTIILFALNGCGYTPMYSTNFKNDFNIELIDFKGDNDLNNFIKEELKLDHSNKSRGTISHRLSHIKINISFYEVCVRETNYLQYQWLSYKKDMAVPKPVQDFLNKQYRETK